MNEDKIRQEEALESIIRTELPEFFAACNSNADVVVLHQDAFAADYQVEEFTLLGMAIKYAGISGKEVHITGVNRSTLGEK